ncbi:hypothetical protein DPMN_129448 [Dreissena polymorpha]|uniref:Uncharacterized protein n=1 Tax=Dreissena polymorpha TaxID=45954 RepID=A0A9D4K0J4_DREPO|nr:hypothetical protein DPMN_129448 [Dreissena polymorpha]
MIGKICDFYRKCNTPGSHETHVLTKFHEHWAKNVTSKVFTCFHYIHIETASPAMFFTDLDHFRIHREIKITNVLTKFHEDRTGNVASRVYTRFLYSQIKKTVPPTGGHVFQRTGTTFELNQHIN